MRGRENASITSAGATDVGTAPREFGRGSPATIVGGEAARRNVARRPAHRHDAHAQISSISADGPMPETFGADLKEIADQLIG